METGQTQAHSGSGSGATICLRSHTRSPMRCPIIEWGTPNRAAIAHAKPDPYRPSAAANAELKGTTLVYHNHVKGGNVSGSVAQVAQHALKKK